MGFERSCSAEAGRLLQVLAAHVRDGAVGEIGTGCGVGTSWMADALRPDVSLITVELDAERAEAARDLLQPFAHVRVVHGDWHDILCYGPFTLLFADGGRAKELEPETLLSALAKGGFLVLDDLTPEDQWPEEWRGQLDPVRKFWLNDPRVHATEILVSPVAAVIIASKI
jgi:predicted O-methyltransferase YrrM